MGNVYGESRHRDFAAAIAHLQSAGYRQLQNGWWVLHVEEHHGSWLDKATISITANGATITYAELA